ncbi:MAG: hypothetical protein L3J46_10445 [Kangiellaceae bacterium]|nr:hypothetical protein [Kangiellaceae bacterium]
MKESSTRSNWQNQMCKNTYQLMAWTGAWLCTTALVTFGSKYLWDYQASYSIVAISLNIIVGFGMIRANIRHLDGADELMKKVQFDAMGIALVVGVVFGLSYEQLHQIQLISIQPEISDLVMLIAITYMSTIIYGHRKYS